MAYFIKWAEVEVNEYDYDQGEVDYVQTYELPLRSKGPFNSLREIISSITDYYIYDDGYKNPENWIYIEGRLDTDMTQNDAGENPTMAEIEDWKNKKVKLYMAHIMVSIEFRSEAHDLTIEEAVQEGFSD